MTEEIIYRRYMFEHDELGPVYLIVDESISPNEFDMYDEAANNKVLFSVGKSQSGKVLMKIYGS